MVILSDSGLPIFQFLRLKSTSSHLFSQMYHHHDHRISHIKLIITTTMANSQEFFFTTVHPHQRFQDAAWAKSVGQGATNSESHQQPFVSLKYGILVFHKLVLMLYSKQCDF